MSRSEYLWGPAKRNVVASFRNLKHARKAIDALESRGFDAGAIRVEGAGASPRGRVDTRRRDSGVSRFVGSRVAGGMVLGGIVGVAIGLLVAAFIGTSNLGFIVAGVAGGMMGSVIGMLLGGVGSIDVTPDWERTFEQDRVGPVTVAVGSDDPVKVARAEEAIRDLDPIEVRRVDERGEPV